MEKRVFTIGEVRASSDDRFELTGLAARTGVRSRNLGGFTEMIAPGAFKRALREKQDVVCLLNHDPNFPLGRTPKTLQLSETRDGSLAFVCQLDRRQQRHQDIFQAVKRGDLRDCSFAFDVPQSGERWKGNERTLTDVNLFDVSIVAHAAYPQTQVAVRHAFGSRVQLWEPRYEDIATDLRNWKRLEELRDVIEEDDETCGCNCDPCREGNCADCTSEDCDESCEHRREAHWRTPVHAATRLRF
jgi:HK97 family phage prohead protease